MNAVCGGESGFSIGITSSSPSCSSPSLLCFSCLFAMGGLFVLAIRDGRKIVEGVITVDGETVAVVEFNGRRALVAWEP